MAASPVDNKLSGFILLALSGRSEAPLILYQATLGFTETVTLAELDLDGANARGGKRDRLKVVA